MLNTGPVSFGNPAAVLIKKQEPGFAEMCAS